MFSVRIELLPWTAACLRQPPAAGVYAAAAVYAAATVSAAVVGAHVALHRCPALSTSGTFGPNGAPDHDPRRDANDHDHPDEYTNARTPGLISKGYAGLLLPHTATFDEKLVTGRSNGPGAYATVYATTRATK